MKFKTWPILIVLFLTACSTSPVPIGYGSDNCSTCEMTIMDQRYGAEVVTDKGKVYKFDSVECLIRFLLKNEKNKQQYKHLLVTSFIKPGILTDATKSFILHSENLPSPMGAYLTAFESLELAKEFKQRKGGDIFSWDKMVENFQNVN